MLAGTLMWSRGLR